MLDTWVGIPALNVIATFRRRRKRPDTIERIGLLCSLALGDTLLFSAAVRSIRAHYPSQRIVFFCGPQNIAAARLIPGIDELVSIDLLDPLKTIQQMRSQHVDILLDFSSWQRLTALYSMLSGAKFIAGFRTPGQRRSRGYDQTVEHRRDRHELDNFRALHQAIGIAKCFPPTLAPPPVDTPQVLTRGRDVVVFHPWPSGVRSHTREWPADRWLTLARQIDTQTNGSHFNFVVTGSPADAVRSESLVQQLQSLGLSAETFVGRDGFASLCEVLSHSALVVSVNTGVMHLAAILGAPTLSLNGPTNNVRWGPVGPHAIGVQSAGEGCGYLHFGFEMAAGAADCMERISVEMVLSAAESVTAHARIAAASTQNPTAVSTN
ncbi:MAG: hypothetical protein NVS9B15_11410 [Acidobacteriaceae bacterium]